MREVARVARIEDRAHDGGPLQLLRRVELVAARHAAGVIVGDPLRVLLDRPDDVALHDLHVVDVVQELDPGRVHGLHHLHPEIRAVSLIVGMVHFAVQQLHHDVDAVGLGHRPQPAEHAHARVDRLAVGHAAAVAEEGDEVGHPHLLRLGERALERLDDRVVQLAVVEAVGDRSAPRARVPRRAGQAVTRGGLPLRGLQQVDCRQAHGRHVLAELVERDALVAPAADRLLEAAVLHGAAAALRPCRGREGRSNGCGTGRGQRLTSSESAHGFLRRSCDGH